MQAQYMAPCEVSIYGLTEAGDDEVRYIGQALRPKGRLGDHKTEALNRREKGPPRCAWIASIADRKGKLRMRILYKTTTEHADVWEEFFIAAYSAKGHHLLNVARNGLAGGRYRHERRECLRDQERKLRRHQSSSTPLKRDIPQEPQEQDWAAVLDDLDRIFVGVDLDQWCAEMRTMGQSVADEAIERAKKQVKAVPAQGTPSCATRPFLRNG